MNDDESKADYSQGVCHDGAAILKNGEPMTPEQIVSELKAAQRQGGEAVAWVDVPEGEQKSPHYPGYSFHGIQFLPAGRHSLHVVPRPAVPDEGTDEFERVCEEVHNSWWREKERQGKADDHPDAIPYRELSETVKEYDRATVRTVIAALKAERPKPPEDV